MTRKQRAAVKCPHCGKAVNEQRVRTTLRLPVSLMDKLNEVADETEQTVTDLVIDAISDFLIAYTKGSCSH